MRMGEVVELRSGGSFSPFRYVLWCFLLFGLTGVLLGMLFESGVLDGYFWALPLFVAFYGAVGVGSGLLLRKLMWTRSARMQSMMLLISLGRLLVVVAVAVLGLWQFPESRKSFLVVVGVCYVEAVAVSLVPALRGRGVGQGRLNEGKR